VRFDEEELYFIVMDPLIVVYLLEELIASRLLRLTMLILCISLRASPDDRVVVDGVLIGGCAGLSIKFVVTGCLTPRLKRGC
jgi:hypothetical protein